MKNGHFINLMFAQAQFKIDCIQNSPSGKKKFLQFCSSGKFLLVYTSVSVLLATLGSTKLHAGLIQAVGPTVCRSERAPMLFIHRGARGVRNIDTLSRDGDFASLFSLALKPGILFAHTGIEGLCEQCQTSQFSFCFLYMHGEKCTVHFSDVF